jgi:diguanylate cyclase (GGDEF)-like protein
MFTTIKKFLKPLPVLPGTIEQLDSLQGDHGSAGGKGIDFESDVSVYLIVGTALVFAFLVHCGLLVFSLLLDLFPLKVFNSISLASYCCCFFQLKRKRYTFIGVFLSIEVMVYTCFSVYLLGLMNYDLFYLLIILVMQIVVPYAVIGIRVSLGLLAGLVLLLIIIFVLYRSEPGYLDVFNFPLTCFNIAVGFVGITVELVIGNVIKKIVEISRQKHIETLETHAHTDSLTGLYNRHYAEKYFALLSETANRENNVVAMLDIDDFKQINDSYGHEAGDKVLIELAALMLSEFRKSDTVIRWGGEEFLIILNRVDTVQAKAILDKLRLKIGAHIVDSGGLNLRVQVTIGLAPLDTDHIKESIIRCDENLYRGKRSGKNQVVGF